MVPATKTATSLYAPGFRVFVDNMRATADVSSNITSLSINNKLNAADECTITLCNERLQWTESNLFEEGSEIAVEMGYHASGLARMFLGDVTRLSPSFPESGVPTLRVTAYGRFHRLTRGKKTRRFAKKRDSEIASEVARGVGLSCYAERTPVIHEYVLQNNQTDIEFLRQLAERNKFEIRVVERMVHFEKPHHGDDETCTLVWGKGLRSFEPTLNTTNQISRVVVRGWDPHAKREITGVAERSEEQVPRNQGSTGSERSQRAFGKTERAIVDATVETEEEAHQLARAILNRTAETFITGRGSCIGLPEIRADAVIRVDGIGTRFSGKYHVTSATHTISQSGYLTDFEVRTYASDQQT